MKPIEGRAHPIRNVRSGGGRKAALAALAVATLLAAPTASSAASASAGRAALAPGWNRIGAGAGTGCADGGEYAFYVRPGNPNKLAVVFAGGGACWSGASCDTCGGAGAGTPYHLIGLETLATGKGLLDFNDERSPIRGYTVVFVPNCTLDVLLGTRVVPYPAAPNECRRDSVLSIRHLGSHNAGAALDWAFANLPEPKLVFVTGQSGGAIPSPLYAVRIARRFPRARVVQVGNAAGGYLQDVYLGMLKIWGALDVLRDGWGAAAPPDSAPWTFERIYVVASRLAPNMTLAQVNYANDEVQGGILKSVGVDRPVSQIMAENLATLHREIGRRFRSYTLAGTGHEIISRPEFRELEEGSVKLRDWIAALLDGKPVDDVGGGLLPKTE